MTLLLPVLHVVVVALLSLLTFACACLWMLAGMSLIGRKHNNQNNYGQFLTRFVFLVPAHNEEDGIAATIRSLKSVDYPQDFFDIVVVADNCTDRTTELARFEGAQCLERFDSNLKGKGYALKFAFEILLPHAYDALVVVDADTVVSRNFLAVLDARIRQGEKVVQTYNGLSNPDASILTYLFQVGNIIENRLFWEPKERLGFPIMLRGTGMCFARDILEKYPWNAFSTAEDTEYGLMLLEQNIHIHFAPETGVYARQPENLQQAFVQRVRWASGNSTLTKRRAARLIMEGIARGNFPQIDTGLSLVIGSKPLLLLVNIVLLIVSVFMESRYLWEWAILLFIGQILYIGLGVAMNGITFQKITRLMLSPFYLVWLCAVTVLGFAGYRKNQWIRTTR